MLTRIPHPQTTPPPYRNMPTLTPPLAPAGTITMSATPFSGSNGGVTINVIVMVVFVIVVVAVAVVVLVLVMVVP